MREHHAPIIPRATFESAGRILDQRAAAPTGQRKCSRRYPLSGKLHCGICGTVCAARKKTRRDGTDAISWRCGNAVKYGRPHTDTDGRCRGCTGESLRNEDALQSLSQVWASPPLTATALQPTYWQQSVQSHRTSRGTPWNPKSLQCCAATRR